MYFDMKGRVMPVVGVVRKHHYIVNGSMVAKTKLVSLLFFFSAPPGTGKVFQTKIYRQIQGNNIIKIYNFVENKL